MPRMADMDTHALPGTGFGFSAVKVDRLLAAQYAVGTIVLDVSGSVRPFADELRRCLRAAIEGAQAAPQADNILLRVVVFDSQFREACGFTPVKAIDIAALLAMVEPGGSTCLHAALVHSINAQAAQVEKLIAQDYVDNTGTLWAITDGLNNERPDDTAPVRDALADYVRREKLGPMTTVLVGINDGATDTHPRTGKPVTIRTVLEELKDEAGIGTYVSASDMTPKKFAQLGDLISQSLSSSAKSAATGAPLPVQPSTLTI